MLRIPSHLQMNQYGVYYFRIAIPKSLQVELGKKEIKRSLCTANRRQAMQSARVLGFRSILFFESVKDSSMDAKEVRQLVQKYFDHLLALNKEHLLKEGPFPIWEEPLEQTESNDRKDELIADDIDAELKAKGARRVLSKRNHIVDELLKWHGLAVDENSEDYRKLCEVSKGFLGDLLAALKKENQVFLRPFVSGQEDKFVGTVVTVNDEKSLLLSELIEKFCDEKIRLGAWTPKSIHEFKGIFNLLMEVMQDVPVHTIQLEQARNYKDILLKLPPNRKTSPLYRTKTIEQILSTHPEKVLSDSTVKKSINTVNTLFLWAKSNGYVKECYFGRVRPRRTGRVDEERAVFNAVDLSRLFSSDIYLKGKWKHPHYYWVPLIGLYSGARLEEICQLHLEDIRQEGDIWVFDFNEKDGKKLKTNSSARVIPIHSQLLSLGILDYVGSLQKRKEEKLFPELGSNAYGNLSASVSKWFARYRKSFGVDAKGKVFHSFRHTVADHLKQKSVEHIKIAAILGHKDESDTTGRYGKAYWAKVLQEVIEQLDFDLPFVK